MYDFDASITRTARDSVKWEAYTTTREIPLWVADMDFMSAPVIQEALISCVSSDVLGYANLSKDYRDALKDWFERYHNYSPSPQSLVVVDGVVQGIAVALEALTQEGDAVLIQTPVYHPFAKTITGLKRQLVTNPLHYENQRYTMDLCHFEEAIIHNQVRAFILCSPHNPVGRVWTKDELLALSAICLKHNVIIIADEIHHDFIMGNQAHTVLSTLSPEIAQQTILCTAPSKSFNLAGLKIANLFIENPQYRARFKNVLQRYHISGSNTLALKACEAAYTQGRPWFDELLAYLKSNIRYVEEYLALHCPQIQVIPTEATYLMWLDFSQLDLSGEGLDLWLRQEAKLWLNNGIIFGEDGKNFGRMNIATQRSTLELAMTQLSEALRRRLHD